MADHSVGARDKSNESEASEALMFCFHNAFPGMSCFVVDWSLSFALPTRFCVPECRRNRVESSTAEKVLFFQFSRSPLRENQRDGGKEFTVAEGIVKVQVGINLRKCVSDRIYSSSKLLSFGSMLELVSATGQMKFIRLVIAP